jgi:3-deoxy-D-manno-octulosonate 8-phosphate phosphatase (KDO 8-P phosphatase)
MNQLEDFNPIRTFIFDVDGVLTNSQLLLTEKGELLRSMNTRDGYAIATAIRSGYDVAIITGGSSIGVTERLKGLGVVHIYTGYTGNRHKIDAYEELLEILSIEEETILYMGDDLPDMEVMGRVGLPVCPADAAPEVRQISRYISPVDGGKGCVRDVIERVLRLNGDWGS